jgi:hypothetical protein
LKEKEGFGVLGVVRRPRGVAGGGRGSRNRGIRLQGVRGKRIQREERERERGGGGGGNKTEGGREGGGNGKIHFSAFEENDVLIKLGF